MNDQAEISYELPTSLVQAIANLLGSMPAVQSRHALNAIETICTQQDQKRAAAAEAAKIEKAVEQSKADWDGPTA